jgi:hypothetical protein
MNAFRTMAFGLAALGAVTLSASPAAAETTVLSYVGTNFHSGLGPEPFGDRITATIELAGPLGADFLGEAAWSSFTISDGVHTLSPPFVQSQALFATDAFGQIVNWRVTALTSIDDIILDLHTINDDPGRFGFSGTVGDDSDHLNVVTHVFSTTTRFDQPGVWTVTTRADPAAVPEPAAWALMIAGFGLAGTALRRRRSVVA